MGPSVLGIITLAGLAAGSPPATPPPAAAQQSFLFAPVPARAVRDWPAEPYVPRAGDLVLFDDGNKLAHMLYRFSGSGGPLHAAIIFRRPDGRPALLEAGPNLNPKVFVLDVEPRLHSYDGTVLVRRLKEPLTPEQSAHLTQFALAQEGKSYSLVRLALQVTPFRCRGPVRTYLFGRTALDRRSWICGELTGAAATAAGVLNNKKYFANAMYPRDFAYDEAYDLSPYYGPPALWYPRPQLEMIGDSIRLIDGRAQNP